MRTIVDHWVQIVDVTSVITAGRWTQDAEGVQKGSRQSFVARLSCRLALLALFSCSSQQTMKITRPVLFIFTNSTSEKELANLGQTSAFLSSDLQQGSFDLTRQSESDAFVFCGHDIARILDPQPLHSK